MKNLMRLLRKNLKYERIKENVKNISGKQENMKRLNSVDSGKITSL